MANRGQTGTIAAPFVALLILLAASVDRPATAESDADGLAGQMLVASRSMADPRFAESVIYMVRHDRTGALGLIVNKPIADIGFADFLRGMGVDPTGAEGTVRLHLGGPVQPSIGFVLHSADYTGQDTIVVDDAMALTARGHVYRAMVDGKGPKRSLIALGYSGWGPGQLEGEIAAGSWYTVPADLDIIFDDDHAGKWRRALALRRVDL